MKTLKKVCKFFDQYSTLIMLILMINLIISWFFTSAKGTYFWISDITLLLLSAYLIGYSFFKRKNEL